MTFSFAAAPPGLATQAALRNPTELVVGNSLHGGSARCAYKSDSIGKAAYIAGSLGYTKTMDDPDSTTHFDVEEEEVSA